MVLFFMPEIKRNFLRLLIEVTDIPWVYQVWFYGLFLPRGRRLLFRSGISKETYRKTRENDGPGVWVTGSGGCDREWVRRGCSTDGVHRVSREPRGVVVRWVHGCDGFPSTTRETDFSTSTVHSSLLSSFLAEDLSEDGLDDRGREVGSEGSDGPGSL